MENPGGNSSNNNPEQQTSLMGGHAQYLKGVGEAAVGSISGSKAWTDSGVHDKEAGLAAMKKAGEQRDVNQGYGRAEEWAGKLTGCEGMQKEGFASAHQRKD
ncbi:hypothetical protein HDV63DRAFT_407577 [Trichoderma sp. SZMC 28014]